MIICHRHRFIFIKSRKTAGSSVEIALSRVCGPGDIVTPLMKSLGEEELRRKEGGYGPAGNLKHWHEHRGFKEWRRLLTRGDRARKYAALTTASELKATLPESVWSRYTKISIERNPWDRALSRYWWNKYRWEREGKWIFENITEFLRYMVSEKPHQMSNWSAYAIGQEVVADHMLFYESLEADLAGLRQNLGLVEDLALPKTRAKGTYRAERQHYTEVLTPMDRTLIERVCAREIEYFGYRYGD